MLIPPFVDCEMSFLKQKKQKSGLKINDIAKQFLHCVRKSLKVPSTKFGKALPIL